jgi:hypothetical protein
MAVSCVSRLTLSVFQCQGLEEEEEGDLPDSYIKVCLKR